MGAHRPRGSVRAAWGRIVLATALCLSGFMGVAWGIAPHAEPTFHCVGLYWKPVDGATENTCSVSYRPSASTGVWQEALPLWFDADDHAGAPEYSRQYRGSIVGLQPDTAYDIRLSLTSGTQEILAVRTWNEDFRIKEEVRLSPGTTEEMLTIRQGGSVEDGYVLYVGEDLCIDTAERARSCIQVDASYVIIRGFTLRGGAEHGLVLGDVDHVVIEDCDISGWGSPRADARWGQDFHSAIYSESPLLRNIVVQRCRLHHPRTDANSWLEPEGHDNHPKGPQGISFIDSRGGHVIRCNEIYSDAAHYFNDGMGDWHNFGYGGFPNRDSDIYGNAVSQCWDDALEIEGACMNVRVWGNYLSHTYMGLGLATTSLGPNYIWRNVVDFSQRGPAGTDATRYWRGGAFFKVGGYDETLAGGRIFLFHNTAFQTPPWTSRDLWSGVEAGILVTSAKNHLRNLVSRNNILQVRNAADYYSILIAKPSVTNSFDYDLYNGRIDGAAGAETHGIRLPLAADVGYDGANTDREFWLSETSRGLDAGVRLPNFNDDFAGAAPDIGAFERGCPPSRYGTRAALDHPTFIRDTDGMGNVVPSPHRRPHLGPNYPNPFNSCTTVPFTCPPGARVRLGVYDLLGQELVTLVDARDAASGGVRTVQWDGRDRGGRRVSSGLYLSVLRVRDEILVRKLALIR